MTKMTTEQNAIANEIFQNELNARDGKIIELDRYIHGDTVTVHVGLWKHDAEGRLIILENYHAI